MCELIKLEPAYKQCASTRFHLAQQVLSGQRPSIPDYVSPLDIALRQQNTSVEFGSLGSIRARIVHECVSVLRPVL
ncbi:unnamed protein product [Echinostoma caproni]|uniref:DUF86 domain-containing protein n=1 Tax=Echinostoma caproni TaxID=27848 RepID=A0A183BEN3_9TREM|nr:unnamed protein product [Echinostoma caproni]